MNIFFFKKLMLVMLLLLQKQEVRYQDQEESYISKKELVMLELVIEILQLEDMVE
jgi:hypothetical protein